MKRRLAAVLAIDVVGYSRLMGMDEVGTLAVLAAHRAEVLEPRLHPHNGRIVKLMGDGALLEFPSAVEAVAYAVEVQDALRAHGEPGAADRRVVYRIGINIGDIIVEGDDIFGDGVNLAARLEKLAEPGGICITGSVHDQVKGKLAAAFTPLGPQKFKNIAEPVPVYRVQLDPPDEPVATPARATTVHRGKRYAVAAGIAVVLIAGGGMAWWRPWAPAPKPVAAPAMAALVLPDKPSIAVLPFANMSDDKAQEYFSDGMTEDVITDLSKISGLFVVARNSTFAYKGKATDLRKVAAELGVRYALEGSVRRVGQQVRINAQLIDATTGGHLWAERYDGKLDDVFSLQDEITRKIVSTLAVRLTSGEQAQLGRGKIGNAEAHDVFLKGWAAYRQQTPEGFIEAIAQFKQALEIDPGYTRAYAALSATYWQIEKRLWAPRVGLNPIDTRVAAEDYLEKARRQPTALSHQMAATLLAQQKQYDEAIAEGGKAIGMDPNDPDGYVALAGAFNLAGNPARAAELVQQAMRLDPHFPPYYLYELGLAQFGRADFLGAAATLEKAASLNPEDRWSLRLLLATYGQLGRQADTERLFKQSEKNFRGYDPLSVRGMLFWYPFREEADRERLAAGLRKANLPE